MSFPSYLGANLNNQTATFGAMFERVNVEGFDLGSFVMSVTGDPAAVNTTSTGITAGHGYVNGSFRATTIVAEVGLRGGNNDTSDTLTISSNTSIANDFHVVSTIVDITSPTLTLSSNSTHDFVTATTNATSTILALDADFVNISGTNGLLTIGNKTLTITANTNLPAISKVGFSDMAADALKYIRVNAGETALEYHLPKIADLANTTIVGLANSDVLTWNNVTKVWENQVLTVTNAATADQWTTTRTISLTGDATGSDDIDGTGNISVAVTGVDSAALGGVSSAGYLRSNAADQVDNILTFAANTVFNDDIRIFFGTSSDFAIHHDGANTNFDSLLAGAPVVFTGANTGTSAVKTLFEADPDGAFTAYFKGAAKFDTYAGGVDITGELRATGDVTANFSSDSRLKTNLELISFPLEKIDSICGYKFNWNGAADGKDHEKREVGVLAQEIREVLPEVVVERDDGWLAVDYAKIVPLLIEGIKELNRKVTHLEKEISNES